MIVTNDLAEIIIAPSNEKIEIAQNIKTILTTMQGSVPLMRQFGLPTEITDAPINPVLAARLRAEILEQIKKYEPRADITKIDINADLNGRLKVKIEYD